MTITASDKDQPHNHQENVEEAEPSGLPSVPRSRVNFEDGNRKLHLQVFYEWLPSSLRHAPGIDWDNLPSIVIRYLVRTVKAGPDRELLAVAAAVLINNLGPYTVKTFVSGLHTLLGQLRRTCGVTDLSQLSNRKVWESFVTTVPNSSARNQHLLIYSSFTSLHWPDYWEHLDPQERLQMQTYVPPPLPPRFIKKFAQIEVVKLAGQERRKEETEILVPLYPILAALVLLRKKLAERLRDAFRLASQQVTAGKATFPYPFAYEETLPVINRDARTVSGIRLEGRQVTLNFVLWDRRSWEAAHPDRFIDQEPEVSDHDNSLLFIQFLGPAEDLLWFGKIIKHRLLVSFHRANSHSEETLERWQIAKEMGIVGGIFTNRPGILKAAGDLGRWLTYASRASELLLDPESLYRGVLYGAALAMIALTNGSRMSELLQVSFDRFKTRTYPVKMRDQEGVSPEKQTIYLQHLIPKGAKTDEERQLFPMSRESVRLLKEIYEGLIAVHGAIPVVWRCPRIKQNADLKPERYLFQWAASPDGRLATLDPRSVTILLRFVLYGIELSTAKGAPILISSHLIRHVTATAARQEFDVPLEAVAWVLHHRGSERANAATSRIPETTLYYSQKSPEQNLKSIHKFQFDLEQQARNMELIVPDERDLESMNEDLQDVFERWQTLHPTAFGYCGCRYLCPRGYNRSLCIGCPYLVPDPDKLEYVQRWRRSYAHQAEEFKATDNERDARQTCRIVQQLDDLMNIMRLQRQAEDKQTYHPAFKLLPMVPQDPLK